MAEIKREKLKGRTLCDSCSKPAVVKLSTKVERKVHRAYACSDSKHEKKAKSSLKGSW